MTEEDFTLELESLLIVAGERIFDNDSAGEFLAWYREYASYIAPTFASRLHAGNSGDPLFLFGLGLWNRFPQPSNGWLPSPLPPQKPHVKCLCGSGLMHHRCCARIQSPDMILDRINLLRYLLEPLSIAALKRLDAINMDPFALADVCHNFEIAGKRSHVHALLEPLFQPGVNPPEQAGMLLDTLLESWPSTERPRKRMTFLDAQIASDNDELAVVALQCKVGALADRGKSSEAWELFHQGMRRFPKDINFAALEITLLLSEQRMDEARMRAEFWTSTLKRRGPDVSDYISRLNMLVNQRGDIAFLDELAESDPVLAELIHKLQREPFRTDAFDLIQADDMTSLDASEASMALVSHLLHFDEEPSLDELLPVALENPLCLSNFMYLHLLAQTLADMQESELTLSSLTSLVLQRGEWLLYTLLSGKDVPSDWSAPPDWQALTKGDLTTTPWVMLENRPALSILVLQIDQLESRLWGNTERAHELMQLMIALNPNDNHGYRTPLSNYLLKQGDAASALKLLEPYDDDFAPIMMNRILALWLTDSPHLAAREYCKSIRELGEIRKAIVNKRYAKPRDADNPYFSPGGRSEAWHYRNEMQTLWNRVGAADWLRDLQLPHSV